MLYCSLPLIACAADEKPVYAFPCTFDEFLALDDATVLDDPEIPDDVKLEYQQLIPSGSEIPDVSIRLSDAVVIQSALDDTDGLTQELCDTLGIPCEVVNAIEPQTRSFIVSADPLEFAKLPYYRIIFRNTGTYNGYSMSDTACKVIAYTYFLDIVEDSIIEYPGADNFADSGDIDGENGINAADASLILSAAAMLGLEKPSGLDEASLARADVNGDGEVNAADASIVLVYTAAQGLTDETLRLEDFIPNQ